MRFVGFLAVPALLVLVSGTVPGPAAQESDPAAPETAAATQETEDTSEKKLPFALYVEAGVGVVSADDLEPSITTENGGESRNLLTLEDMDYYRAALGWKMPDGKGDFRVTFNGYKENGYRFVGEGFQKAVTPSAPVGPGCCRYWLVIAEDGNLSSSRFSSFWELATDDANGNEIADIEEITTVLDYENSRTITDNLQNRVQSVDLVYGRTWGKRRYTARWWGGLRYFEYKGNIPAAAWLKSTGVPGNGYTEGFLLKLINFAQDTSGAGPTGAVEADFNFFEDRLTLFLGGQFAFILSELDTDSGDFFTLAQTLTPPFLNIPVPARLQETRNKSTWHNTGEAGVRVKLKNGLQFEAAYFISGFLDAVLLPTAIQIPANETELGLEPSAIYKTQDLVFDGWRSGLSFQF